MQSFVDEKRVDHVVRPLALGAVGRPVLRRQVALHGLSPLYGLHHLADHAVCEHHDGRAVIIRNVEGLLREIRGLLYGRGREHDSTVIPVAAAARRLKIIRLRGRNVA